MMTGNTTSQRVAPASTEQVSDAAPVPRAKHLLRDALEATGTSERAAANRLGVSRRVIQGLASGDRSLTLERVLAMPRCSLRRGLAKRIIDALIPIAEDHPAGARRELASRMLSVQASVGEASGVVAAALANGRLEEHERPGLRKAVATLEDQVEALRREVA